MEQGYLETRDLSVGYHGQPLIRDLNFSLEKGEILSLIGPNGAGKTTILKHIIRQMKPLGGAVWLDGKNLGGYSGPQLARKMSVVLTRRVRPELMSCRDVVSTGRYPYTGRFGVLTERDLMAVERAMEMVHITDLAERDFSRISDGQKQRVMLARAICQEPEVIVLDEPTAYLDIRHKIDLLDILRTMAREKKISVVMSLHEIDLAVKVSDKLLCVGGNGETTFGTPRQILAACPIDRLYSLEKGSYDPLFGSVELVKPEGTPEVFVVAGAGCGIPVYRQLQKNRTPFAAGILFENDVDYQVAKVLSDHVVSVPAFLPMTQAHYCAAAALLESCHTVIDAGAPVGELNMENRRLLALAAEKGIPIRRV